MHTKITDAIEECGPGHPAHVTNPSNGRIVAIRDGLHSHPNTFRLDFSDPKVDLRQAKGGSELYNVPAKRVQRVIAVFLGGHRTDEGDNTFEQFINQATRECWVIKVTPTRCRIEYELPNSGITGSWRDQTTIGGYTYVGSY